MAIEPSAHDAAPGKRKASGVTADGPASKAPKLTDRTSPGSAHKKAPPPQNQLRSLGALVKQLDEAPAAAQPAVAAAATTIMRIWLLSSKFATYEAHFAIMCCIIFYFFYN